MIKTLCILALFIAQFSFAEPITLMTFNIRYGTANDGENSWEFRREHVVETIRNASPGVIAIQEALLEQLEYIDEQLSGNVSGLLRADTFRGLKRNRQCRR